MNFSGRLPLAPVLAGLAIFGFLVLVLFARSLLVGEPGLGLVDIEVALGAALAVMATMAAGIWWGMRRPAREWRAGWQGPGDSTGSVDQFERFDDAAQRSLTFAQDEAQRLGHNYIGTEHLLLGLLRVSMGVAARSLANLGVELDQARTAVEFIIGPGAQPTSGEVGLTPRAKRVLHLTIVEARRLGHDYVGTEHLLLGILREGEGIAAGVLQSLGVGLDRAQMEVMAELGRQAQNSGGTTPEP